MPTSQGPMRARVVGEFARGFRTASLGLRTWGASPKLMATGLVPGAITAVVFAALAMVVIAHLDSWSEGVADAVGADDGWLAAVVRVVAALAILGGSALIGIYTFTAITLLVGQPFFERLARGVDARQGFAGEDPDEGTWRALVRGLGEAVRLGALTVPLSIGLFLVGLVPVVGGVAALTLGAAFGGWFLALELTTYPLARRGVLTLRDRRAVLKANRGRAVGFGAACFLAFLIPLGAVVFMPAAVAGATHLAEELRPSGGLNQPRPTGRQS